MPSPVDAPSASSSAPATTSDSPFSQLLKSLGMSRDDLERHTSQMRQLLDSENALKTVCEQAGGGFAGVERAISPKNLLALISAQAGVQGAPSRPPASPSTRPSHRATAGTPSPTETPAARSSRSISRLSNSCSLNEKDSDRSSERGFSRRLRTRTRELQQSHNSSSPFTRPKISLDEVMKLRSYRARRASESEESEESDEESLRDVFAKRLPGTSTPRYRYPHPARATESSVDGGNRYYRDTSPASSVTGNYYRDDLQFKKAGTHANNASQTPTRNATSKAVSYYRRSFTSRDHSSPPASSSPMRYPYNLVSSPGPMSDPPDQYDVDLPYTLPKGPYSDEKPEFSYAALIGQAIMASPQHSLRLKDIYDYISIVYPFFKRDGHSHSQKWMNAIRQNLTNTPQFFKKEHPSGKASKGALWCIADRDLPCFADGGYNRHALNPDTTQSQKAEKRKRKKEEKLKEEKMKRARVATPVMHPQYTYPYGFAQLPQPHFAAASIPAPVHADIIFPPLPANHPNAHLINTSVASTEPIDQDVLFPPLPASSQTRIVQEQRLQGLSRVSSSSSLPGPSSDPAGEECPSSPVIAPPLSSESSLSSIPELTPNNSSSSPREAEDDGDEDEFAYFSEYIESETQSVQDEAIQSEGEALVTKDDKGKGKALDALSFPSFPLMPTSPTTSRLGAQATRSPSTSLYAGTGFLGYSVTRSSTPPNDLSVYLGGSHLLTPVARRNPPSTPTRKRKVSGSAVDNEPSSEERPDFLRAIPKTPSRRNDDASGATGASALTPRRIFSPFIGFSPFRTPSRRNILDAADPSRMLDDELDALAAAKQRASDSPDGLFPRGKGLLYESPSLPSPGKWRPW